MIKENVQINSNCVSKIVIVWVNVPNYLAACIKALAKKGCEVLVIQIENRNPSNKVFQFGESRNITFVDYLSICEKNRSEILIKKIIDFKPNYVLLSFTHRGIYKRIAKHCYKAKIPVVAASDSYYAFTLRQSIRIILSFFGINKFYKGIFVPGYKGFQYARLLGFRKNRIIQGLYSCDDRLFRKIGQVRHTTMDKDWPRSFIFIGQLIERKGIDTLIEAYKKYNKLSTAPWKLQIIGDGPKKHLIEKEEGIEYFGSLDANNCAKMLGNAGCFILPSIVDHWGVVIHEACCSGLPVIITDTCGGSVELVSTFYNGCVIPNSDINSLLRAMLLISSDIKLARDWGKNSLELSKRITTSIWVSKVLDEIPKTLEIVNHEEENSTN